MQLPFPSLSTSRPICFFLRRFSMPWGSAEELATGGLHSDRAVGGDRDYRDLSRAAASRGPGRSRSSPPYAVPQQSEAVRHTVPPTTTTSSVGIPWGACVSPHNKKIFLCLGPDDAPELHRAGEPDRRGCRPAEWATTTTCPAARVRRPTQVISGAERGAACGCFVRLTWHRLYLSSRLWRSEPARDSRETSTSVHGVNYVTACFQEAGARSWGTPEPPRSQFLPPSVAPSV